MKGNGVSAFNKVDRCLVVVFLLFFTSFFNKVYAQSEAPNESLIQIVSPREGPEVIAKKPLIKCIVSQSHQIEDMLVLLDGVDITGVLDISAEGFQYKPIEVLAPGIHTLNIYGNTEDGNVFEEELTFSTRHFQSLEEAYVGNELTVVYNNVLTKTNDVMWRKAPIGKWNRIFPASPISKRRDGSSHLDRICDILVKIFPWKSP